MKLGLPIVSETCLSGWTGFPRFASPLISRISIGSKNLHVTTIYSVDLSYSKVATKEALLSAFRKWTSNLLL
jgi:hypothetical protein